jgi:hypothetical protein
MNDSGASGSTDLTDFWKVGEQSMCQGSAISSSTRMHDQIRGLVENDERVILVENLKITILGLEDSILRNQERIA